MSYANTAQRKGCGSIREINLRNFSRASRIKRYFAQGTVVSSEIRSPSAMHKLKAESYKLFTDN